MSVSAVSVLETYCEVSSGLEEGSSLLRYIC